jgi:tetratricopeptide (TPR) repeat protein
MAGQPDGPSICADDSTLVRAPGRPLSGGCLSRHTLPLALRIEHPNHLIVMLIAGVAVFGAIVAALQMDANARAAEAGRRAQEQALLAVQDDVVHWFDFGHDEVVVRSWRDMLALGFLARLRELDLSDDVLVRAQRREAQRSSVVSESLTEHSALLKPPYFDASSAVSPDQMRYLYDTVMAPRVTAGEEQAAQARVGQAWGSKSNAHQTIMTLVSVTLFLYGLALTLKGRLKLGFVGLGSLNCAGIMLWAALTGFQPVPQVNHEAIRAYVTGAGSLWDAGVLDLQSRHEMVPGKADQAIASLSQAVGLDPDYASAYAALGDAYRVKGQALLFSGGDATTRDASLRAAADHYRQALRLKPGDFAVQLNLSGVLYLLGDYAPALQYARHALDAAPAQALAAQFLVALNLSGLGQPAEALAECRRGIEYAAAHPLGTDALYFRQAIRNLGRLQAVRPSSAEDRGLSQVGLADMERLLKESFVSLQYLGAPFPRDSLGQINNLTFGSPLLDRSGKAKGYQRGSRFPFNAEQVSVLFDYTDMVDGEKVVLKVYFNGTEQPFYNQMVTWQDGPSGHSDRLAVRLPIERTLAGLWQGRYLAEIYIEGNLRASGEFTVGGD